jgi:hypothetical protein
MNKLILPIMILSFVELGITDILMAQNEILRLFAIIEVKR